MDDTSGSSPGSPTIPDPALPSFLRSSTTKISLDRQTSPFSDTSGVSRISRVSRHSTGSGCIGELSVKQSAILEHHHRKTSHQYNRSSESDAHRDSFHEARPPSLFTALVSGAINFLLMFGLCGAYGMIIFSDDWHLQHRTLGVKMNLGTAFFVGVALSFSSKIPVAIGGPDLNPVVFLAGFVEVIGEDIAGQLGLSYPSDRRLSVDEDDYSLRGLGSSEGDSVGFCVGEHLNSNFDDCSEYHEQLRATVIFATTVSSATLGILFFCIGRLKLTRLVRYVPTCIMEAFLSCVGYKVFKYALKFCKYDAIQFVPAAFIGVLVYFLKALHIGKPALMIPIMLLTPLAMFYGIVFGSGSNLAEARANDYMFPEMEDVAFWTLWTEGVGNFYKINFDAWIQTLPDLAVMVVVCLLDCLLKLSGTETKLPVKVDQDFEVTLHGMSNLLTVACGSSVGYMQLKFNVINYGILGNATDRRGGLLYALLCGVCFFGTVQFFNLQPRFFLGMLLFFAGAGFVAENLWGSRAYLTSREWMQIFAILGVFVFTEKLLYAVTVGGLLTCIDFILTYSKISCVLGEPMHGGELSTQERYDPVLLQNLQYITNSWLLLIKLKGFVFFGSAQSVIAYVRSVIESQTEKAEYKRLRYVVFDCKLLDGMDVSASKSFRKVVSEAASIGVRVLWSHVQPGFVKELKQRQILKSDEEWFVDLREAVMYVEVRAVRYLQEIQTRWVSVHPALVLYKQATDAQANFEPFEDILTLDTMRHGCPWMYCNRVQLSKHRTLLWEPGQIGVDLFLIHTGAVALYNKLPCDTDSIQRKSVASTSQASSGSSHSEVSRASETDSWPLPVAIYRHGWFINCEMVTGSRTRYYAVALENGEAVCWGEREWYDMTCEQPEMASAITKAVMKQQKTDWELLERDADQAFANAGSKFAPGTSSDTLESPPIPDKLQNRIDRLQTTQVLHQLGLFSPPSQAEADDKAADDKEPKARTRSFDVEMPTVAKERECMFGVVPQPLGSVGSGKESEDNFFPDVPAHLAQNMEISFSAYSSLHEDLQFRPGILSTQVHEALLYAGIPDAVLAEDVHCSQDTEFKRFSLQDFLLIGQSAVMARFNQEQVDSVKQVFNYFDTDGSGELDRTELDVVMRQLFFPSMSIEEIDGMARFWDNDGSGGVDEDEFCKIASRLVRQRQMDWLLLLAFQEMSGIQDLDIADEKQLLTFESLLNNSRYHLTDDQVEEMLWAVDWRRPSDVHSLQLYDVLSVVMMRIGEPKGILPPEKSAIETDNYCPVRRSFKKRTLTDADQPTKRERTLSDATDEKRTKSKDSVPSPSRIKSFSTEQSLLEKIKALPKRADMNVSFSVQEEFSSGPMVPDEVLLPSSSYQTPPAHVIDTAPPVVNDPPVREDQKGVDKIVKSANPYLENFVVDLRDASKRDHALDAAWEHHRALIEAEDQLVRCKSTSSSDPFSDINSSTPEETEPLRPQQRQSCTARLHRFLNEPKSSKAAKLWSINMFVSVTSSLVALIMRPVLERLVWSESFQVSLWSALEFYFMVLFSLEFGLRLYAARRLGIHTFPTFFTDVKNFCDMASIVPYYAEFFLNAQQEELQLLRINRLVRVVRVLRLIRVSRILTCVDMRSMPGAVCTVFAVIWGIYLKNKDA